MPTSEQHSIPYRDGTSENFGGGGSSGSETSTDSGSSGGGSDVSGRIEALEKSLASVRSAISDIIRSVSDIRNYVGEVAASIPEVTAPSTDVSASGKAADAKATGDSLAGLTYDISLKAPLESPVFTGTPTAPTAAKGTDTTQVATTAFVNAAVGDVVVPEVTAPSTDISDSGKAADAKATGDALALKAPLASPDFTGTPTAPTAPTGTNTTQVATTAFVQDAMAGITPGPDNSKLDSTSAAPSFDSSISYDAGSYVTYNGVLYECISDVFAPASGSTNPTPDTDTTHWQSTNMTSPDATLDITSEGRLSVVSGQGEVMWMEGYGLSNTSSSTLVCNAVQLFAFPATTATAFSDATAYAADDRVIYDGKIYKFTEAHAAGAWTGTDAVEDPDMQEFTLPTPPAGIVGDFVLDIDNSANADGGDAYGHADVRGRRDVRTGLHLDGIRQFRQARMEGG